MKGKVLTAALVLTLLLTGCRPQEDEVRTVTCPAEETTLAWSETIENASDFVPGADASETDAETQDSFPGIEETTLAPDISEDTVIAEDDIPDALKCLASPSDPMATERPSNCAGSFETAFLKYAAAEGGNVVISPASAKLAMSMVAMGAGEGSSTEKELLDLFGYASKEDMALDGNRLMNELNREDGSLSAKNSLWASDKAKGLNSGFTDELANYFYAESFVRDLTSQGFVDEVNGWIDKNTNGLITEMIDEPLSGDARLALVNTLYFKNGWRYHFNDRYPRGFYGTEGFNENAPAMSMTEHIMYSSDSMFKSVKLDYTDGSCMKIFLPADESKPVTDIIAEMSAEELSAAMEPFYSNTYVHLTMPPFECDYEASLVEMFKSLGVKDCFNIDAADFSGITSEENLFISDVMQAAKIICDEKGTEAAAATSVTVACCSDEPSYPVVLIIDRPFLYTIESPSGETLFMGVITDIK